VLRDVTAVLGGSGFLGAHVVRRSLAAGHEVVSVSRAPFGGAPHAGARFTHVAADLLGADALERVLDGARPARVIVCTAISRIEDCERDRALATAANRELPARAAAWVRASGARLVHVSTDLVFGTRAPPPGGFGEGDEPGPISAYGTSKLAGERAVLAAEPTALVVRVPLLYGDSFGRGRGASDSLLAQLERGEHPALFTDEIRTPLDVDDAAAALVELASRRESGLLHVAGPEPFSRYDLGLAVLRGQGRSEREARELVRPATRAALGMDAHRPADVSLDSSRARAILATPLRRVAEALARGR
jgi:dTDP-4-dehydrorhamnose reductase